VRGFMSALALGALLPLTLIVDAQAAEDLPAYWLATSLAGADIHVETGATPPAASDEPVATIAPKAPLQLRAKIVGGRRAFMMWPHTYAEIGKHAVVSRRGWDRMAFTQNSGPARITNEWAVTEESYSWDAGGKGSLAVSADHATGEQVTWTAPAERGDYQISVTGQLDFKFRCRGPNVAADMTENSGPVTLILNVRVEGDTYTPPVATTPTPPVAVTPAPPVATTPTPPVVATPTPPVPVTPAPPVAAPPTLPTSHPIPVAEASDAPRIVSAWPGAGVPPRVMVHGTGAPRATVMVDAQVRSQDGDALLAETPARRASVEQNGAWHVSVDMPRLPAGTTGDTYCVVNAHHATAGSVSPETTLAVYPRQTTPPTAAAPTPPVVATTRSNAPVIFVPSADAEVPPRVEVSGRGTPGTVIVVYTEVYAVADDRLVKNVPGLRHRIGPDGTWSGAIAAPRLRSFAGTPLYYIIKAYCATPDSRTSEAAVTVHKP